MYKILFLVVFLIPTTATGQSVVLEKLGGPEIRSTGEGQYIRVVSPPKDTLWLWVQHVTKETPPDRKSARHADKVVWCYPQKYKHPNHLLPKADGRVAFIRFKKRILIVEVGTPTWEELPQRLKNKHIQI